MPLSVSRTLAEDASRLLRKGELAAVAAVWERVLDAKPEAEAYEAILLPFGHWDSRDPRGPLYDMLARADRGEAGLTEPWRLHLRIALLDHLQFYGQALEASLALKDLPSRYGFMRAVRGMLLLPRAAAYGEARVELEASFAAAPAYWKAEAMAAECLLCLGDEAGCIERMDRCVSRLRAEGSAFDRDSAVVWRAAIYLWTGRYQEALRDLEEPARRGQPLAHCWRGAARLLTGDLPGALADLELTQRKGRDPEGAIWLAEAHERLGDLPRALALYERAAHEGGPTAWVRLGRALVKLGLGDEPGFWADVAHLPRRMIDLFEWRSGVRVAGDAQRTAVLLRTIRSAAHGLRRPEEHMLPVFMRPV